MRAAREGRASGIRPGLHNEVFRIPIQPRAGRGSLGLGFHEPRRLNRVHLGAKGSRKRCRCLEDHGERMRNEKWPIFEKATTALDRSFDDHQGGKSRR